MAFSAKTQESDSRDDQKHLDNPTQPVPIQSAGGGSQVSSRSSSLASSYSTTDSSVYVEASTPVLGSSLTIGAEALRNESSASNSARLFSPTTSKTELFSDRPNTAPAWLPSQASLPAGLAASPASLPSQPQYFHFDYKDMKLNNIVVEIDDFWKTKSPTFAHMKDEEVEERRHTLGHIIEDTLSVAVYMYQYSKVVVYYPYETKKGIMKEFLREVAIEKSSSLYQINDTKEFAKHEYLNLTAGKQASRCVVDLTQGTIKLIVMICVGSANYLKGNELKKVLETAMAVGYKNKDIEIVLFYGNSTQSMAQLVKRESTIFDEWQKENAKYISSGINVTTILKIAMTKEFIQAAKAYEQRLLSNNEKNRESYFYAIIACARSYFNLLDNQTDRRKAFQNDVTSHPQPQSEQLQDNPLMTLPPLLPPVSLPTIPLTPVSLPVVSSATAISELKGGAGSPIAPLSSAIVPSADEKNERKQSILLNTQLLLQALSVKTTVSPALAIEPDVMQVAVSSLMREALGGLTAIDAQPQPPQPPAAGVAVRTASLVAGGSMATINAGGSSYHPRVISTTAPVVVGLNTVTRGVAAATSPIVTTQPQFGR